MHCIPQASPLCCAQYTLALLHGLRHRQHMSWSQCQRHCMQASIGRALHEAPCQTSPAYWLLVCAKSAYSTKSSPHTAGRTSPKEGPVHPAHGPDPVLCALHVGQGADTGHTPPDWTCALTPPWPDWHQPWHQCTGPVQHRLRMHCAPQTHPLYYVECLWHWVQPMCQTGSEHHMQGQSEIHGSYHTASWARSGPWTVYLTPLGWRTNTVTSLN